MAYNEKLADRLREALAGLQQVEEKKMFGGLAFMVNEKMCLTAGKDRIMCRIDPAIHDEAIKNDGVTAVIMKGREYKGFVHVQEQALKTKKELEHWVKLALEYNKTAKPSRRKS
jgi:TfoX/Sxy family transcriptional regulator of competence genes